MADYLDSLVKRGMISDDAAARMKPYLDFATNFAGGGLQRALGLPNNAIGEALQNPDNQLAIGGLGKTRSAAGDVVQALKRRAATSGLPDRLKDLKDLNQESVARLTRTPEQGFGVTPQKSDWVTLPDGTMQRLYTGK
jgi:hypothetical protein